LLEFESLLGTPALYRAIAMRITRVEFWNAVCLLD
jgi:hypothetical protein